MSNQHLQKGKYAFDIVKCALPLFVSLLILIQYTFLPNFRNFTVLDRNAPTAVFFWFSVILVSIFFVYFVLSFFFLKLRKQLRHRAPFYSFALLLLLAYDWATLTTGMLPQPFFPWPDAILNAIIRDRAILGISFLHSMRLLFTGYFLGLIIGVITGIAAGWSAKIRYWVAPVVRLLAAIPPVTWLPIILIVANSLFSGAVFLIALAVWYPVTQTTMNGVLNIPKSTLEAAKTFGTRPLSMIFKVCLPATLPSIFQGAIQGMSIACTALIIAEMMGVEAGLGWYINWQRGWAEFAGMYAAILIICITFLCVNTLLSLLKTYALPWKKEDAS